MSVIRACNVGDGGVPYRSWGVLFRFYECGACSCLRSEAMCSFPSISFSSIIIISFTSSLFFEVRYESPIPGMMIPVARAHLMMMAAFAVAFC